MNISIIDFYKEKGYRDARIFSDTLIRNEKGSNTISLNLDVEEGSKYYFGEIDSVFSCDFIPFYKVIGILELENFLILDIFKDYFLSLS